MRVEVVEKILGGGAADVTENASVKLAVQSFNSALQSDDSVFDGAQIGTWHVTNAGDGRANCSGGFELSLRDKEAGRNRATHVRIIRKLMELLKNAGSPEIFAAKLCLSSKTREESAAKELALKIELEAVGDSNEQAALRWGLGLAHLQQALLFTSRYVRQQVLQKKS